MDLVTLALAKIAGGGSSQRSALVAELEYNSGTQEWSLKQGVTEDDIVTAFNENREVLLHPVGWASSFRVNTASKSDNHITIFACETFVKEPRSFGYVTIEYAGGHWSIQNKTDQPIDDELPTPVYNNGKILGVQNDEYALVSPAAISDFEFTITKSTVEDPETHETSIVYSSTTSIAQIIDAINRGKTVIAINPNNARMQLTGYDSAQNMSVTFTGTLWSDEQNTMVNAVLIGVSVSNVDAWSYAELATYYNFNFTYSEPGGIPAATPETGVTYAAIKAALEITPNVYATVHFSDGVYMRGLFSDIDAADVRTTGLIYDDANVFVAYRLKVNASDDSADIKMVPLQAASI